MLANTYLQIQQLLPYLTCEERRHLIEELKIMVENEAEPLHDIMEFEGFAEELWKDVDVEAYLKELRGSVPVSEHDITELKGSGKEIWKGIDAQEYVDRERDSWG
ncbi:MAG: hypothetical protein NVSMB38_33510 [Ktedonobacteraceae bacterium]